MSDLRIRLEGRVETVEAGTAALEELLGLSPTKRWQAEPERLIERIAAWREQRAQLDEAFAAVEAHDALHDVAWKHASTKGRLSRTLSGRHAPLKRAATLEAKLEKWEELAAPWLVHRPGPPLLEGACRLRPPQFWKGVALSVVVLASPGPLWAAGATLGAAFAHLVYTMRTGRFRLYDGFLELEDFGGARTRIPHGSLTKVEHNVVVLELHGLWSATLVTEHVPLLAELALRLNRLKALKRNGPREEGRAVQQTGTWA